MKMYKTLNRNRLLTVKVYTIDPIIYNELRVIINITVPYRT